VKQEWQVKIAGTTPVISHKPCKEFMSHDGNYWHCPQCMKEVPEGLIEKCINLIVVSAQMRDE
jgi:hypothetical protein